MYLPRVVKGQYGGRGNVPPREMMKKGGGRREGRREAGGEAGSGRGGRVHEDEGCEGMRNVEQEDEEEGGEEAVDC